MQYKKSERAGFALGVFPGNLLPPESFNASFKRPRRIQPVSLGTSHQGTRGTDPPHHSSPTTTNIMSHDHLLHTPITEPIDPQLVAEITSHPPWVSIPGTFNTRDLGGSVKPGFIFRSGTLENVREEGLERIRELGIGVVVDLRSGRERREDPEIEFGEGVEGVWFEEGEGEGEKRGETSVSCSEVLMARMGY